MSVDIALKACIGLLGASAVSLGGYGINDYFTNTLSSKYTLLDEKSDKWSQLVTKYEEISKTEPPDKPKKIDRFSFSTQNPTSESKKKELIDKCKDLLNTSLREEKATIEKREEEIKDWCIEDATALKNQNN